MSVRPNQPKLYILKTPTVSVLEELRRRRRRAVGHSHSDSVRHRAQSTNLMESKSKCRSLVSEVGTDISSLGEELLIEIFSRLGPQSKNAVRCKSVSKLWLSILSTSCFIRRWRQINHYEEDELPVILLTQYRHSAMGHWKAFDSCVLNVPGLKGFCAFESFNFLGKEYIYILATCRDLVLCCSNENDHNAYYLCNPFTKRWTALPPPPNPTGYHNGFDNSVQFGLMVYDDDGGYSVNFKILRIVPNLDLDVWTLEIFCSQDINAGWRMIDNADGWKDVISNGLEFGRCVLYDGMLVWLIIRSWEAEPIAAKLAGFRLNPSIDAIANVNCTLLPTPPGFVPDSPSAIIALFQGRLRLAQWAEIVLQGDEDEQLPYPELVLKIWQLNSDWELLYVMNFRELENSTGYSIARSSLLDRYWRISTSILNFDPQDGDILYLKFVVSEPEPQVDDSSFIFMCNGKQRTLELIRKLPYMPHPCDSLRLSVPSWPTAIPLLPSV